MEKQPAAGAGKRTRRRASPVSLPEVHADPCSVDARLRILTALPFFSGLGAADVAGVQAVFHDRGYAPGEAVYHAGQAAASLYVVATGRVKLTRQGSSGQSPLIDMLGEGDFFGSRAGIGEESYSDSAVAHAQSCVLSVGAASFQSILERFPTVSLRLVAILAERLKAAHERLEMLNANVPPLATCIMPGRSPFPTARSRALSAQTAGL